jgi:hypothetical protein
MKHSCPSLLPSRTCRGFQIFENNSCGLTQVKITTEISEEHEIKDDAVRELPGESQRTVEPRRFIW